MTTVAEFTGGTSPPAQSVTAHRVTDRTAPGKFLRSVWRIHFYLAIFAAPILIVMALSGLVIMYTEPIQGLLSASTRTGSATTSPGRPWRTRSRHRSRPSTCTRVVSTVAAPRLPRRRWGRSPGPALAR